MDDTEMKDGFIVATLHEIQEAEEPFDLRNYQIHAINRIIYILQSGGKGALLAYAMGLRKTVIVIGPSKLKTCVQGKFLLVVPLALIPLWQSELQRAWNQVLLSRYIVHGGRENDHSTERTPYDLCTVDVVITTYETLRKDYEEIEAKGNAEEDKLGKFPLLVVAWMAVFLDEAHKLCNEETGVSRASMALKARFLLPMTGASFQNEYSDCGTMMRLLGVAPWDNAKAFKDYFLLPMKKRQSGGPTPSKELKAMMSLSFRAFTLRLNRHDIFEGEVIPKEIVPGIEKFHRHSLSRQQENFQSGVRSQWEPTDVPVIIPYEIHLSAILKARLACVYEQCAFAGYGEKGTTDDAPDKNQAAMAIFDLLDINPANFTTEQYKTLREARRAFRNKVNSGWWASPRTDLVVKIIKEHISKPLNKVGKIVVFPEFLCTLDVLRIALEEVFQGRMSVLRFDATVPSPERLKVIADFNSDENAKAILVTTRSGGVGLSFTSAGRVTHLTQSWNPAMM
ncbi:hypothetical protein HBI18_112570 [Parastagonospora nodorum]|nr:hypothetical protein HBI18_112570 [Parastagonospora nodorum]